MKKMITYIYICLFISITFFIIMVLLLILSPGRCFSKEYLGEQPTTIGMVKIYIASEKEINRELCRINSKFVHGEWLGFASKNTKEVWGVNMAIIYYHIDLLNDPTKWGKEVENDNRIIQEDKLERWMKDRSWRIGGPR